jgi:hypothetical protein
MLKATIRVIALLIVLTPVRSDALEIDKPKVQRVVLIVLENQDYDVVAKNSYFSGLAKKGTVFTQSYAVRHPSYANYIGLVSGDPHGIWNDNQVTINKRSIGDLLEAKQMTWKNYAEGYPGTSEICFIADDNESTGYVRRHVPFLSFENVQHSKARCANVVDAMQFKSDVDQNRLPTLTFYSPNLCNSGHGGKPFCSFGSNARPEVRLDAAAKWLESFVDLLLRDTSFIRESLIIITFDESHNYDPLNNRVYTLFLGDMVNAGAEYTARIDHYSVLRTIEYLFSLGTLGENDDHRDPIMSVWK